MAITIRNKTTEAMIRAIGRRTGEGPSAVIRRLAESETQHERQPSEDEIRRRIEFMEELSRKYPPPDPKPTWKEIEKDIEDMYAYLDEEPAETRKGPANR